MGDHCRAERSDARRYALGEFSERPLPRLGPPKQARPAEMKRGNGTLIDEIKQTLGDKR
jgi:hypothetical protein